MKTISINAEVLNKADFKMKKFFTFLNYYFDQTQLQQMNCLNKTRINRLLRHNLNDKINRSLSHYNRNTNITIIYFTKKFFKDASCEIWSNNCVSKFYMDFLMAIIVFVLFLQKPFNKVPKQVGSELWLEPAPST